MKRRNFVKKSAATAAGAMVIPTIVPSTVFGKDAPSNKINIGQIGCGRIARSWDMPATIKFDDVRFVAVSDLDSHRMADGKKLVEDYYTKKTGKKKYVDVKMYGDYKEMLKNKDIDAVVISTPDHWHAQPAMEAALAGKDIYLQKPTSLTVTEGRQLSDVIKKTGVILQMGTQQRSMQQFRIAAELVRNGRIGTLQTVKIGLPGDPAGPDAPEMPVPPNLNYDMWLGSTPLVYYTELRVHPQQGYSRPGWLRCEQFGAGMITGWGQHHVDSANWGMNTSLTGPTSVEAVAQFPRSGIWDVHMDFMVKAVYEDGVEMYISNGYTNGIRYEGTDGWIFVSRGNYAATASDPVSQEKNKKALDASDPKILEWRPGPNDIHLYVANDHHRNWIDCIKSREAPISPIEEGHRACTVCLISSIAMHMPGQHYWNPETERFVNDPEADKRLSRTQRYPYGTNYVKV